MSTKIIVTHSKMSIIKHLKNEQYAFCLYTQLFPSTFQCLLPAAALVAAWPVCLVWFNETKPVYLAWCFYLNPNKNKAILTQVMFLLVYLVSVTPHCKYSNDKLKTCRTNVAFNDSFVESLRLWEPTRLHWEPSCHWSLTELTTPHHFESRGRGAMWSSTSRQCRCRHSGVPTSWAVAQAAGDDVYRVSA